MPAASSLPAVPAASTCTLSALAGVQPKSASALPSTSIVSAAATEPACARKVESSAIVTPSPLSPAIGSSEPPTSSAGAIAILCVAIAARSGSLPSRVSRTPRMPVAPSESIGATSGSTQPQRSDTVA